MANSYFSVAAYFVVLREVLEACLIVGIVIAYLDKTGNQHLNKFVWWGTALGVAISLAIGIALGVVFWTRGDQLFTGNAEYIFEGITFLVAAALLTWMIVWMLKMGKNLRRELEERVESQINKGSPFWLGFMIFMQIFREGIETVIFILGTAGDDSWQAIPIPAILGLITGVALAWLMFKGLVNLNIFVFFAVTSMLLIAFAAGLVSRAFHELQEAGWFGTWDTPTRDWYNVAMWNTKACCSDKENEFFAMLRALFGYQDTPTWLEFFTYFAYWLIVSVAIIYIHMDRVRVARNGTAQFMKTSTICLWFSMFICFIWACGQGGWNAILISASGLVLSTVGIFAHFDSVVKLCKAQPYRKLLSRIQAWGYLVLTLFSFSLNIAQSACENGYFEEQCSIPHFYYFLFFFTEAWSQQGPDSKGYVSLALLAISLVIIMLWCGLHTFYSFRFTANLDENNDYIYNSPDNESYNKLDYEAPDTQFRKAAESDDSPASDEPIKPEHVDDDIVPENEAREAADVEV